MEKYIDTPDGKIAVDENERIFFPEGIYAFENLRNFYILKMDNDNVFHLLQSEERPEIAFIIINPYLFKKDYVLNVREEDLKYIKILSEEDAEKNLAVFTIVTINENSMTANLLGPIIINLKEKIGKQALALNEEYSTKHDILSEIENNKEIREALGVSTG
ncbi:MAG TPA: flagellar assembly protein FliW [Spirochaetota bacterium]|nr:flagellar assembly protein FliW [Spirochaetota bacterium]HOM38602.1 flagellar assembly protein FliW [Spirochaetota bacterium]HPQ49739.1 flagellar assembly protein FliW [Spirochaetota bacterium]